MNRLGREFKKRLTVKKRTIGRNVNVMVREKFLLVNSVIRLSGYSFVLAGGRSEDRSIVNLVIRLSICSSGRLFAPSSACAFVCVSNSFSCSLRHFARFSLLFMCINK